MYSPSKPKLPPPTALAPKSSLGHPTSTKHAPLLPQWKDFKQHLPYYDSPRPPTDIDTFHIVLFSCSDARVLFLAFGWLQDVSSVLGYRIAALEGEVREKEAEGEKGAAGAAGAAGGKRIAGGATSAAAMGPMGSLSTSPDTFDTVWGSREADEKALRAEGKECEKVWGVAFGVAARGKVEESVVGKWRECEGKMGRVGGLKAALAVMEKERKKEQKRKEGEEGDEDEEEQDEDKEEDGEVGVDE
ncbi:hypothetical protein LTS18_008395 [Coniosporium uncinatum]|uniref:Uncharacterized protein n=1 Tax=Coniosporium uncinatum TaxID=93489 RepID=A0ACC3DN49_9PEZI|nr:hypothetical protein LTS18_008395 [Coniosporium uncinatum]